MTELELLHPRVASAFYGRFSDLRPAQKATIRPLISGQSIVLSSATGSGKTEAVLAPLLSRHWEQAVSTESLVILYIAPTKALANDLEKRLSLPANFLGLRVGIRHGDRDDLRSGPTPHILVTTPESLDVMLVRKDSALKTVLAVVIDEVHLLYNTQRGLQLSILLRRLRKHIDQDFQCAALSATVGRLPDISEFLFGSVENTSFLDFPTDRPIDAHVRHIPDEARFLALIRKLTEGQPTKLLVFSNSRRECERLARVLNRDECLRPGVFAHYSSLSTDVRLETEQAFAAADTAVCIATSTLELGIDIGDIDAVILWGPPATTESFLQRIGRGNRRSHKTNAICLIPDNSQNVLRDTLGFLALVDTATKGELPANAPYELFGAAGQQCLSVIASNDGRFERIADLCELMDHKAHLARPAVENILAELAHESYLQRHGFKNRYGAGENLYTLVDYRLIYGNFGLGSQTVEVHYGSKQLGSVPTINLLRVKRGMVVGFAGQRWHVKKVTRDSILVEPAQAGGRAIDFIYPGPGVGFDAFLTNRIWELLHTESCPLDILSAGLRAEVEKVIARVRSVCVANQIPYHRTPEGMLYLTFGGYLVNKATAIFSDQPDYTADDISLRTTTPIDWKRIPQAPESYEPIYHLLVESSSEQSVYQTLLPLDLQRHEFLQDWVKGSAVKTALARLGHSEPVRVPPTFLH